MKFTVSSGKVKECVLETKESGKKYWVTPKKKWLVAHEDGTPMDGCEVYVEPVEEVPELVIPELPTAANLVAEIKAFMDEQGIEYNSSDLKADLLQKIEWFYKEA